MQKTTGKEKRLWIKCPHCGYDWSPNPKLWRNWHLNSRNLKPLVCPCCGKKVLVSAAVVKHILEHAGVMTVRSYQL